MFCMLHGLRLYGPHQGGPGLAVIMPDVLAKLPLVLNAAYSTVPVVLKHHDRQGHLVSCKRVATHSSAYADTTR